MTSDPATTQAATTPTGGSIVDKVKGKAKEAVGTVIGDDQLVAEGKLHEAKAAAADDAVELSQTAAQKQAEADLTAREKDTAAELKRVSAEADAAAAEKTIQSAKQSREAQAARDAATAKANVAATKRNRVAQSDKTEFDAARQYSAEIAAADEIAAKARRVRLSARLPKLSRPTTGLGGTLRGLPGRAVLSYLGVLRLPLTTYERRTGSDASAASVAFQRFDAAVRGLVGSTLKDPALLAEARRENVEIGRLGEAAELQAAAKGKRARADERLATAKKAADAAKKNAVIAESEQSAKVTANEKSAKQTARNQAADAKDSAASKAADRKAAVEADERAGSAAALRKEQEALASERAALSRGNDVVYLDDAVDASKAARSDR